LILTILPRDATQSAVLPWQVVRLSVRLSVTYPGHKLEFLENNFTDD